MAELQRLKQGLLGSYNSLTDEHLANYFSNPRIRRHLLRAGLIRHNGELVSTSDYRARMLEEQRWLASQAFLAQAIVQRALDLEYNRRAQLRHQLEEIIRTELVERVRSARAQSSSEDHSSTPNQTDRKHIHKPGFFSPLGGSNKLVHSGNKGRDDSEQVHEDEEEESGSSQSESGSVEIEHNPISASSSIIQHNPNRPWGSANSRLVDVETSPYSLPMMPGHLRGFWRTRSAPNSRKNNNIKKKRVVLLSQIRRALTPGPKHVQYSCCEISLRFQGTRIFLCKSVNGGRQEVSVKQQFTFGNPVIVFCQPLIPGSVFAFTSRRYNDFPFSITIHVDGLLALQLSACCEFKYQVGRRLGGARGYFTLVGVHGNSACPKCEDQKGTSFLPRVADTPSPVIPTTSAITRPTWSSSSSKKTSLPYKVEMLNYPQLKNGNYIEMPLHSPDSPDAESVTLSSKNGISSPLTLTIALSTYDEHEQTNLKGSSNDKVTLRLAESSPTDKNSEFQAETLHQQDSDDEIQEEIQDDMERHSRLERVEEEGSDEVEEQVCEENEEEEKSESGSIDSEGSSTEDSEEGSDEGGTTSETTSSQQPETKDTVENTNSSPNITVTRPESAGTSESHTVTDDNSDESDSSESSSGSSETTVEEVSGNLLRPEDACRYSLSSSQSDLKSDDTKGEMETNQISQYEEGTNLEGECIQTANLITNKKYPLESGVPFDSSDEEETKLTAQVTTVRADVHNVPITEDQLRTDINRGFLTTISEKDETCDTDDPNGVETKVSDSADMLSTGANSCKLASYVSVEDQENVSDSQVSNLLDLMGNLCTIDILNEELDEDQIQELGEIIDRRPDLTSLTIRQGGIDDLSIIPLVDALIASPCPLQILNLNLNQLGPQAGHQIARVVQTKPTLEALSLHGNPLHDSGIGPIMEAVMQNSASDTNDVHDGLRRLDLGDCNFRNEGANSLASVIEHSLALTTLVLTGNGQLSEDDWSPIFWAVGKNPSVTTLLLDYCDLGKEGLNCLITEIQSHPALKTIDLEGNEIDDEGGRKLLTWLHQNNKITELHIETGNDVKESILLDVKKLLESRRK